MGTILKVVSIPRGSWHDLEEVLLEEMTVFRVGYSHITNITSTAAMAVGSTRADLSMWLLFLTGANSHYSNGALNKTGIDCSSYCMWNEPVATHVAEQSNVASEETFITMILKRERYLSKSVQWRHEISFPDSIREKHGDMNHNEKFTRNFSVS